MAEAIPFSIVTTLITKLGAAAFNEISLVYGVEDELGKLKDTLSTIQAALLDADQRKEKSNLMKDWIRKLNDAVYDADDLLDAFATKALQRQLNTTTTDGRINMNKVRDFFSSSNPLAFSSKVGHKIEEMRERFDEIAANMSKFNFTETRLTVQAASVRETDSFVLASELIGRDRDKEEIIKLIMCSSNKQENVSVISIVGIGGLGKTALTQLVFNDKKVVEYFELKLWVCVSEEFEKKTLIRKMLESLKSDSLTKKEMEKLQSLTKNEVEKSELDQLQIRLRQKLDGKRYLLVLDDVWNEKYEKWVPVKNLLMGGAKGSKIVVSTRSSKVASAMGAENPYILKGLTQDQAWTLFEKLAFRGHEKVPPNLEVIGKELTEKCKGVPLAIRSLASVMQSKTQESEWSSVRNSDVWSLCEDDGILPILKLSYDQLPIQLRQCFAYCSIFPKDYEIQKEVLIQLWMAQGYVQSLNNIECLEDIGDQYFRNLSSRLFFQDAKVNNDNEITSCKMHDLIHDLAIRVAGSDCAIAETHVNTISNRVRHVSIAYRFEEPPRQLLKAKGLRTFLPTFDCANDYRWLIDEASRSTIMPPNFTCLRVLDLHECGVRKVPSSIGKLQHMRYLDLSRNKMTSLPNSIRKLVNLQTLKLSDCNYLERLPEGITKLINLRYLVTDDCCFKYMPSGMGKLNSLRKLNKFVVGGSRWGLRLSELNGLNEIRGDISIENLENVKDVRSEAKEANLMGKQYLHSLTLKWERFKFFDMNLNIDMDMDLDMEMDIDEILLEGLQPHPKLRELSIDRYRGKMFPSWMTTGNIVISLPNIVRISLNLCSRCRHLPPLNQLPSLKFLELQRLNRVEHIIDEDNSNNQVVMEERKSPSTPSVFFPSLEQLVIEYLPNLKGWWRGAAETSMPEEEDEEEEREESSFPPRLTKLRIVDCPKLTSTLIHPSLLEELAVGGMVPKKLVRQLLTTTTTTTTGAVTETEGSAASSSSSSSTTVSKLKSLRIMIMDDLESLPQEELLWKNFSSLDTLVIFSIGELVSLPVWLQQLTALRHLRILYCPSLMALPDWLSNLTSLQSLEIYECRVLSERCQKETGEDWSIISHIPSISIDEKYIQH